MSDTETQVADSSEVESEVKEALFAYDHSADEVSETQDTQQQEQQAEPEAESEHDLTEDSESAESAEVEDSEATEIDQADSQNNEEKSPKEDPEAHQYWQSKYQKAESKLGIKPEEIPDEHAELIKTFMDHPEYLQGYAEYLTKGQTEQKQEAEATEKQGPKTLQRPEKPEKPVGYDHYEAFNDPESDSFKYRLAKEEYMESLAEYAEKKADSTREELSEKEKQREQKAKAKQVRNQWYSHLTQNEGFTDQQFQDFWQWKDKGQFEPQEIISMYKAANGIDDTTESKSESVNRTSKTKSKESKQKKSPPSPATTAGAGDQRGASKKKGEEDQLFGYF